jgi:hypothetical protein
MPRPDTDWLLAGLLHSAWADDRQFKLTVFAGGLAVSGTAVEEQTFVQRIGLVDDVDVEAVARKREEHAEEIRNLFSQMEREDISVKEEDALLSRADDLNHKFIMMVDVTIFGAGPIPITAPVWRGRLSQISGWVPGSLNESE